jgi:hypothetical protein
MESSSSKKFMPKSDTNVEEILNFMMNDADIKVEIKVIILVEGVK